MLKLTIFIVYMQVQNIQGYCVCQLRIKLGIFQYQQLSIGYDLTANHRQERNRIAAYPPSRTGNPEAKDSLQHH